MQMFGVGVGFGFGFGFDDRRRNVRALGDLRILFNSSKVKITKVSLSWLRILMSRIVN